MRTTHDEQYSLIKNDINSKVSLEGLYDDLDGFRIIIHDKNKQYYKISFSSEFIYRIMDEGDRLASLEKLSPTSEFMSYYQVSNSSFIRWFKNENLEKYEDFDFKHFVIITENTWIDVIALDVPTIDKIDFS